MIAHRAVGVGWRVRRFGSPPRPVHLGEPTAAEMATKAVIRVTHASLGSTDALAIQGRYLLQPRPGFVPGYDLVGVVEHIPTTTEHTGLTVGQRVAAVLPTMGSHASHLVLTPQLLVPVPEWLDSADAATVPLDALTAAMALSYLDESDKPLLIQGAAGAVGSWATQMAVRTGRPVYGTGSARSLAHGQDLGATMVDYRNPDWPLIIRRAIQGGVIGAVDHTGTSMVRDAVTPQGRVVRIAFDGISGSARRGTTMGALRTLSRWAAQPSERVCSVPALLTLRRQKCRSVLETIFDALTAQELQPPQPIAVPVTNYPEALEAAAHPTPGHKVVLVLDETRS